MCHIERFFPEYPNKLAICILSIIAEKEQVKIF